MGTGTDTGTDTGSGDCGYVPSSCSGDLNWAVSTGKSQYPEYYQNFQSVTGVALSAATSEDMQLFWYCVNANPNGNCGGLQAPCGRTCYPSNSGSGTDTGTDTGSSSGTITISQKSGANQWWYAVTVTASSGLTVTGLKMKGNGQWWWKDRLSIPFLMDPVVHSVYPQRTLRRKEMLQR